MFFRQLKKILNTERKKVGKESVFVCMRKRMPKIVIFEV